MNKKSDDFESYETKFGNQLQKKIYLKGKLRQWVLAEAVDRSENAYEIGLIWLGILELKNPGEWYSPTSGFKWDKTLGRY